MRQKKEVNMKKMMFLTLLCIPFLISCERSGSQTLEDAKTAVRYIHKGIDSLWGKDGESRQISSEEEFVGPQEDEFIPLNDKDLRTQFQVTDAAIPQPKVSPGLFGSGIPSMHKFLSPEENSVFQNLHFATDDHVVRDYADLVVVQKIANYLKRHPKTYLCVEGHCDERHSAAYNMALGTRRANHLRVLLIKQGIDFNRIYTVSHGKEKPIAVGHTAEDWKKNRRVQFKIFDKK